MFTTDTPLVRAEHKRVCHSEAFFNRTISSVIALRLFVWTYQQNQ
jgi:hypothetical protein